MITRIMLAGDLHGNLDRAQELAELAEAHECSEIVQLGDWGFIWPGSNQAKYLSSMLKQYKLSMRFLDGNHDVHPELRKLNRDEDNNVAPGLTYQFRGSKKVIGNITIVFLGGAPSIDYKWRKEGRSWWPEEEITQSDVDLALSHKYEEIDILATHDAAIAPAGLKITSDMTFNYKAGQSTGYVKKVLQGLRPKHHFHGHYHARYSSFLEGTKIEGIAADVNSLNDNYYIYEKEVVDVTGDRPTK